MQSHFLPPVSGACRFTASGYLVLMSAELLLEAADECLYRAKRNGRNCAFAVNLSEGAATGREPRLVEFQGTPAASPDAIVTHGGAGRRRT